MMFIPSMQPRDDRPDGDRGFVSLRDRLAAAALTGLLACPSGGPAQTYDDFADESYTMADAMLRRREKKQ